MYQSRSESCLISNLPRLADGHSQEWLCHGACRNRRQNSFEKPRHGRRPIQLLVAAATAAAATAATGEGLGGPIVGAVRGAEDGELDGVLLAGTLGAGDFLLLVDDDFFEAGVAVFADVFVDGHVRPELALLIITGWTVRMGSGRRLC